MRAASPDFTVRVAWSPAKIVSHDHETSRAVGGVLARRAKPSIAEFAKRGEGSRCAYGAASQSERVVEFDFLRRERAQILENELARFFRRRSSFGLVQYKGRGGTSLIASVADWRGLVTPGRSALPKFCFHIGRLPSRVDAEWSSAKARRGAVRYRDTTVTESSTRNSVVDGDALEPGQRDPPSRRRRETPLPIRSSFVLSAITFLGT